MAYVLEVTAAASFSSCSLLARETQPAFGGSLAGALGGFRFKYSLDLLRVAHQAMPKYSLYAWTCAAQEALDKNKLHAWGLWLLVFS